MNTINNGTLFDADTLMSSGKISLDSSINSEAINLGANKALNNLQNLIHDGDTVYNGKGKSTEEVYFLSDSRTMEKFPLDANGRINMSKADQLAAFDTINDFANNVDESELGELTLDEFKETFLKNAISSSLDSGSLLVKDDAMLSKIGNGDYEENLDQFIADYKSEFGITGSDYEVLVNVYLEGFDLTSKKYIEDNRSLYDLLAGAQDGSYGGGSLANIAFGSISDSAESIGSEISDNFTRGFNSKTTSSLIKLFKEEVTTVPSDYINGSKDPNKSMDIRDVKYLYEAMLDDPSFALSSSDVSGEPTLEEKNLRNNWNIMNREFNSIEGLASQLDRHEAENGITPYEVPDISNPAELDALKAKFETNIFNLDTPTSNLGTFNEKLRKFIQELDMGATNPHRNVYAGQQIEASKLNAMHDTKSRPTPRADGSFPEDNSIPPMHIGPTVGSLVITAIGEELKKKALTMNDTSFVKLDSSFNIVDNTAKGADALIDIQTELESLSNIFNNSIESDAVEDAVFKDMKNVLDSFFNLPDVKSSYRDLKAAYNDLTSNDTDENRKAYIDAMGIFNQKLLTKTNGSGNTLEQEMILIADEKNMSSSLRNAVDKLDGTIGNGVNFDSKLSSIAENISDLRNTFEANSGMNQENENSKIERDLNFYKALERNGSSMTDGLVKTFDDLLSPTYLNIFIDAGVAPPPNLNGTNVNKISQIADWLENEVLPSIEEADINDPKDLALVNLITNNSITNDMLAPFFSAETTVESDIEILRNFIDKSEGSDSNLNNILKNSANKITSSFNNINAFTEFGEQLKAVDDLTDNQNQAFEQNPDTILALVDKVSPKLMRDLKSFVNSDESLTVEEKAAYEEAINTFNSFDKEIRNIINAEKQVDETDEEFSLRLISMRSDLNKSVEIIAELNNKKIDTEYKNVEAESVATLIEDNKSGVKDMSPRELLLTMYVLQMFEQSSWDFNVWLNDTSRYS